MLIKLPKTKVINGVTFRLSLITESNYFYSNYKSMDSHKNTLTFNRKSDVLVGHNVNAYIQLEKALEENDFVWASSYLTNAYKKFVASLKD